MFLLVITLKSTENENKIEFYKTIFALLLCFFIHLLACVNVRDAKRDPKLQELGVNLATQSKHYSGYSGQSERFAQSLLRKGKRIFHYDTFGDEVFWSEARDAQICCRRKIWWCGTWFKTN